ncbi:MAG: MFS transporter [Bacteroidota bacterium]
MKAVVQFFRDISPFRFDVRQSVPEAPEEIHRSMQDAVWEGALAGIMASFIGGVILAGFALSLGANEVLVGLVAAIQAGANTLQMRAFRSLERHGNRKAMAVKFATASRLMWVVICAVTFTSVEPFVSYRIWIFLGLFTISAGLGIFSYVPWTFWLVDLVPERVRGRFFAQRNLAAGAVGVVLGVGAGAFIDYWNEAALGPAPYAFVVLVAFGLVFGLWAVSIQNRMYDPPYPRPESQLTFWESLKGPFSDPAFRRVFSFRVFYDLSLGMVGTFYSVYMLTQVHLSFTFVSAMVMLTTLTNLLSLKFWGRMVDRFGNKPILYICLSGKLIFALLWVFTTPTTFLLYVLIHLFGLFDAGNSVAILTLVYKIAPAERRANYITVDGTMVGIAATVAPLVGGGLAVFFSGWSVTLGPLQWQHFHFLFLASVVMRVVTFVFLRKVQEPEAVPVTEVVSVLRPIRSVDVYEGFEVAFNVMVAPARYVLEKIVPISKSRRRGKRQRRSD